MLYSNECYKEKYFIEHTRFELNGVLLTSFVRILSDEFRAEKWLYMTYHGGGNYWFIGNVNSKTLKGYFYIIDDNKQDKFGFLLGNYRREVIALVHSSKYNVTFIYKQQGFCHRMSSFLYTNILLVEVNDNSCCVRSNRCFRCPIWAAQLCLGFPILRTWWMSFEIIFLETKVFNLRIDFSERVVSLFYDFVNDGFFYVSKVVTFCMI